MGTSVQTIEKHYGRLVKADRRGRIEQSAPKFGLESSNVTAMRWCQKGTTRGNFVRLRPGRAA